MVQGRNEVFVFFSEHVILNLYHSFFFGNILTVKRFDDLEELLEPFGWDPTLHDLEKLTSIHDRWSLSLILRLRRHYGSCIITYLLSHGYHIVAWLNLPVLLRRHRHDILLLLIVSLE